MYHEGHCQEKMRRCEEKREEKRRYREEKRARKLRYREEKREEKNRHREAKRRLRNELFSHIFNPSSSSPSSSPSEPNKQTLLNNNLSNSNSNSNSNVRIEQDVANIRTVFPDCDPGFIRECLANETEDHVRKVAEKLLTTSYPKVAPVSHLTPPTAPPLPPTRNSHELFNDGNDDEAPPSYEESLGKSQFLQPPPLPGRRHQRSSSWNGTGQPNQPKSRDISNNNNNNLPAAEAIGTVVKSIIQSIKPSTIEQACHKYSYVWTRPVPKRFDPKSLSKPIKILPKDKYSIQKGFNQNNFPSRDLRSHDLSEEDWHSFMSGLNSIIGVNSVKGSQNNLNEFSDGLSIGLKWVSWMNVAVMDEKLMERNISVINEYINKWNNSFFIPRKIMVQLIYDKTPIVIKSKQHSYSQYLLVKSI